VRGRVRKLSVLKNGGPYNCAGELEEFGTLPAFTVD
jgi:hypothetical protein